MISNTIIVAALNESEAKLKHVVWKLMKMVVFIRTKGGLKISDCVLPLGIQRHQLFRNGRCCRVSLCRFTAKT